MLRHSAGSSAKALPGHAFRTVALALAFAVGACTRDAIPADWPHRGGDAVRGTHGMVVTTDSIASQVGVDVLRAGGNAVDAAVAVQFALTVVNPEAGNIGGGGFMVVRLTDGTTAALDFRERAPLAATRDMYLDSAGNATDGSLVGHLASGVPGSVAGMWAAHQRFGALPWADLLEPAIRIARGFEVRERFLGSIDADAVELLSGFPASAAQFLPRNGQPPLLGDTLRQPDLARTLERTRDRGADGFYRGETADLLVAEMERGGGIISHEDLAGYEAVWREPTSFEYRGHTVLSMSPSSSGGTTLAEMALILERYDLAALGWHSAESIHLYAEAWKRAYADRNQVLADPDFVEVPVERMTSAAYAAERAESIATSAATPSAAVAPGLTAAVREGENTTHYSIVDDAGNAVVVTTTLNSLYGSGVTVTGAGFVLNNEMDDFAVQPGSPNQFGLVQGALNAIEPGKRMLSSMTPTIVVSPEGSLLMLTGTPGGATITTTVFQTISNVLDYGMGVVDAVNAPRVHHQHLPDALYFERRGLPSTTVRDLEALGHTVTERRGDSGDVQMILVVGDTLTAWSDPRGGGRAIGY
ncbi:MAG: gamma-glutamyltransferase [Gemmatimonadetes bacterium]|nr:gamma-glutamyltransferase [Gemmatimonadota bacterium]